MPLDAHHPGSLGSSRMSKSQAQSTAADICCLRDEGIISLLFQLWGSALFLSSPDNATVEGSKV